MHLNNFLFLFFFLFFSNLLTLLCFFVFCNNRNVVQFLGTCTKPDKPLCILTEFLEGVNSFWATHVLDIPSVSLYMLFDLLYFFAGGSLSSKLASGTPLDDEVKVKIARGVAAGTVGDHVMCAHVQYYRFSLSFINSLFQSLGMLHLISEHVVHR